MFVPQSWDHHIHQHQSNETPQRSEQRDGRSENETGEYSHRRQRRSSDRLSVESTRVFWQSTLSSEEEEEKESNDDDNDDDDDILLFRGRNAQQVSSTGTRII